MENLKPIMRSAARILLMLSVFYALYLGVVWGAQRHLLFPAWGQFEDARRVNLPNDGEWWELKTEDGVVEAAFILGDGVSAQNPGPVVVFVHGNGDLVDRFVPRSIGYIRRGVSVLMPEYRGYGRSAGEPSQDALMRDAQAFLERLKKRPEVDSSRIVYHGHSMGGGIAGALAGKAAPRGLVLESTFESIRPFAHGLLAPKVLVRDPFDTRLMLTTFKGLVLIIHGTKDPVIPIEHAEANLNAAHNARYLTYDAGHIVPQDDAYWGHVGWVFGRTEPTWEVGK